MKVVLQPDGTSSGKNNFEKTVVNKIQISSLLQELSSEERSKILDFIKNNDLLNKPLAVWRFKPSKNPYVIGIKLSILWGL